VPNVASGKENLALNAPEGTKLLLERLRKSVAEVLPEDEARVWCKDNGMFLGFVVDRFWLAHEAASAAEAKMRSLDERAAEIDKKRTELEGLLETIEALNSEHVALLADFKKAGGTRKDLLDLLRLAKSSGTRPAELVSLLDIENVPGIASQLSRLEDRLRQRIEENGKLEKAISAMQEVIAELVRKKEELGSEIDAKMRDLERADDAVNLACAVARDVGLYVDWIRDACAARGKMTVREVMLVPALVMAGAILEAAASAYGDKEITLMPGPRHPLPMQVTLREISRSLAPPEAYREQAARASEQATAQDASSSSYLEGRRCSTRQSKQLCLNPSGWS